MFKVTLFSAFVHLFRIFYLDLGAFVHRMLEYGFVSVSKEIVSFGYEYLEIRQKVTRDLSSAVYIVWQRISARIVHDKCNI